MIDTNRLLEISPASIDLGKISFDLFALRESTLILFCRKGYEITTRHLELLERRQTPFYVKKHQWKHYVAYAQNSLPLILMDRNLDSVYRSEVMHTLAIKRFGDWLAGDPAESDSQGIEELTESFVDYLEDSPEAAIHLFKRSETDDPKLQRAINCATFNNLIGQRLYPGDKDIIRELTLAGLLHDIGMTTIPAGIVNKRGKLSADEFEIVKLHCQAGADLLSKQDFSEGIVAAALGHHERYDGTGYPQSLTGEHTHRFARITAISDVYDALTSWRPYAEQQRHIRALQEMKEQDGKYDDAILSTLADVVLRNETLIRRYSQHTILIDPEELQEEGIAAKPLPAEG